MGVIDRIVDRIQDIRKRQQGRPISKSKFPSSVSEVVDELIETYRRDNTYQPGPTRVIEQQGHEDTYVVNGFVHYSRHSGITNPNDADINVTFSARCMILDQLETVLEEDFRTHNDDNIGKRTTTKRYVTDVPDIEPYLEKVIADPEEYGIKELSEAGIEIDNITRRRIIYQETETRGNGILERLQHGALTFDAYLEVTFKLPKPIRNPNTESHLEYQTVKLIIDIDEKDTPIEENNIRKIEYFSPAYNH